MKQPMIFSIAVVLLLGLEALWAGEGEWVANGPETRGYGVTALALDAQNPGVLYAGADGLFKSVDGSASWSRIWAAPDTNAHVKDILIDPNNPNVVYVAISRSNGDLFKSVDSGKTWTALDSTHSSGFRLRLRSAGHTHEIDFLVADPLESGVIYVMIDGSLKKSVDGGLNWRDLGQPAGGTTVVAIDPRNPNIMFAGENLSYAGDNPATYESSAVFKSVDGGANWSQVLDLKGGGIRSLAIDPYNPDIIYAGSMGKVQKPGFFRSVDGGENWTQVHERDGPFSIAIDPHNPGVVYAVMRDRASAVLYKSDLYRFTFSAQSTVIQQTSWGQVKALVR